MIIVGIVGNERVQADLRAPADEVAYVPIAQAPRMWVKLAVRTHADAAAIVPAVREAVRQVDDRLALADVRTMEQIWSGSLAGRARAGVVRRGRSPRSSAMLAALGLYGVLSHAVAQRRREIGIRMALGARAHDVLSLVARSTLAMVGVGLVVGLIGAAVFTRAARSLLFEVSALEPAAFVFGVAAMAAVALLAAVLPARRATRVDPGAGAAARGLSPGRGAPADRSGVLLGRHPPPDHRTDAGADGEEHRGQRDLHAVGGEELGLRDRRERRTEFDQRVVLRPARRQRQDEEREGDRQRGSDEVIAGVQVAAAGKPQRDGDGDDGQQKFHAVLLPWPAGSTEGRRPAWPGPMPSSYHDGAGQMSPADATHRIGTARTTLASVTT